MTAVRIFAALAGGVLAVLAITGFWLWRAAPVPMPDAPGGRFACVSYAPFRGEQTPFDPTLVIPRAQIEEDLTHLKTESDCVRIYAVNQGLDQVLPIAETLGMKVLMGLWVGRTAQDNEIQIARGIELAKAHPGTIKGIIVGNEVLLRQEQPASVLEGLLKRVKAETGLPVTYADVWEFWLRHPELADDVDFVTIHILPYWEDDPVPAGDGVTHIDAILRMVEAEMPGKTIYIGETGYPSAGKQRERALPGLVEQASFIRGFLAYAHERGLDYNVIEAFDQPWKRALEGTVGGYWGVFSEGRTSKFPLTGPVARMGPPWPWLAGTIALGIVLWWPARRAAGTPLAALAGPLLAGAAALAVVLQIDHAQFAAWYWHERALEGRAGADLGPGRDAGTAAHPRRQHCRGGHRRRESRMAAAPVAALSGCHLGIGRPAAARHRGRGGGRPRPRFRPALSRLSDLGLCGAGGSLRAAAAARAPGQPLRDRCRSSSALRRCWRCRRFSSLLTKMSSPGRRCGSRSPRRSARRCAATSAAIP